MNYKKILALLVITILLLSGCDIDFSSNLDDSNVTVHFIDVGQADATLIKSNFGNILIDGGESDTENDLISYIKAQNVDTLDYVIATHPHSDHIGGLDKVIDTFEVKNVIMPKVTTTTTTFKKLVTSIKNKQLKAITPVPYESFSLGNIKFTILAPNNATYENLNDYSVVLKMEYVNTSFIFSGDAETLSEKEILNKGFDISADVYKVGHHGSSTSSSEKFVNAINPKIAVISVGKDNSYGHPHKEILTLLRNKNLVVYRTDEMGNIVLNTDGNKIVLEGSDLKDLLNLPVEKSPLEVEYVDENGEGLIKGNINSKSQKIYHMPGGAYYTQTNPEILFKTEKEALENGFTKASK